MLKIILIMIICSVLTACASPGMLGQPVQEVTVSGSKFRIYMRSGTSRVEAHRVSFEPLPSKVLILTKAVRAIEIATGCNVEKNGFSGDQAIIKARVDCRLP